MVCSACGSENEAGRKFCGECGAPLAVICGACGAANSAGVKFCGECGAALTAAPSPPPKQPPAAPQSERRLVSVLFADLVGFTTASENRDAEDTRELLSRYFDTCRRLIELYGGTVEKFIGDAVMAVWGTPVANEDDAERAVRTALDLVAAVADLHPGLRARAGILTGEAAVTIGAEGQGMVAGDLVNTASRIQSVSEPGTVLVGEATKRATEAAIAYAEAGMHELKGKTESVPLWRAVRVTAGRAGALKSVGLEPPFVGRDRELRLVKELFHASAEERRAHLVSVVGIAGIGKSRLAWEFFKYIDGLADTIWWHRGRCLAYGEGVAYWALAEMVRMRAEIAEGEAPVSAAAKLRAAVELHIADGDERAWIEPRLAHLIGVEEGVSRDRDDLFAAWRLFFERMAEQQPLVMVFEDLQWADASLLDFVEYLLEWSRSHGIFVLALARPELSELHPTFGTTSRNSTTLSLEPLSEPAMAELLDGFVPGLPESLRDQILARSEGVPLYAVETVRMLLDRGQLEPAGEVYRPTGAIEALDVPETLHALIAARLDGLSPDERRLVQDASVLGKVFYKQALTQLAGITAEEADQTLASLVRKEVLTLQTDPRSPERGQYAFLQDLLRRVAYETLAKTERKARHLAAVSFIERDWGPAEQEIAEVIASHLVAAYETAPDADDAADIQERAVTMLSRAGERSASLAANDEAQRYFERAAALTTDPLISAGLHERAGRMAQRGARADEANSHFEQSIASFESIGLTHPAARVSAALAEITWQHGRIEEAVERMQKAFDVLSGDEQDADLATLAAQLGRLLYFIGRTDDALAPIELALGIAESLALAEVFSQALQTKGFILGTLGRTQEGITLTEKALRVALENDLSSPALRAYANVLAFKSDLDDLTGVPEMTAEALTLARRVGDRVNELRLLGGEVSYLVAFGRWNAAIDRLAELTAVPDLPANARLELLPVVLVLVHRSKLDAAREVLGLMPDGESTQDVQTRALYHAMLATLLQSEGRSTEALAAGESAYGARGDLGLNGAVKEGLVCALEAALALGDLAKAEELLRIFDDLRPGETTTYLRAQGARFAARLAAVRGDQQAAARGLTAAAALFRELDWVFWLAVTLLEHAELTGEASLRAEAVEIFEQLGATPWLERAAAVASEVPA